MNYLSCFDDIKFIKRILNVFDENIINIILKFLSEKDRIIFFKKVKSIQLPHSFYLTCSHQNYHSNICSKSINYCFSLLDYPVPKFSSKKYKQKSKKISNLSKKNKNKSKYNLRIYVYENVHEDDNTKEINDEINKDKYYEQEDYEQEDYSYAYWLMD